MSPPTCRESSGGPSPSKRRARRAAPARHAARAPPAHPVHRPVARRAARPSRARRRRPRRQQQRPIEYYAAIVHLVTAADGAASFDEARGGVSRTEAMRLDAAIHEVQSSHPNYLRIDNSTDFEGKLRRATHRVLEKLGV